MIPQPPQLNLWQQDKAELFVNNLNIEKLNSLNETILHCQQNKQITQTDLNTLVENFNDIIFVNAETSFGYKNSRNPCTGDTNSTNWFGHRSQLQGKNFTQHAFNTNYARTVKPKIIFQKQVKHTNALSESFTQNTNEKLSKIYDN